MKGNNHVILVKRKSPTPLLKLEILEACRTESGSTFHESTILFKKLKLKSISPRKVVLQCKFVPSP